jgi:ferrous iron transport protein B
MRISLAGNPNVGKSVIFSKLTGVGVISSNYPGTTVEYEEGRTKFSGMTVEVLDLPGSYSLAGNTEDERVATDMLYDKRPDVVIDVMDATRLERNLVLLFELIESGYTVVAALNMHDLAVRSGLSIDIHRLESILKIPVIPTVAIKDEGVDELLRAAMRLRPKSTFRVRYDSHIEGMLSKLEGMLKKEDWSIPLRSVALRLLTGDDRIRGAAEERVVAEADRFGEDFEKDHDESVIVHIGRDRFGEAGRIAREIVSRSKPPRRTAFSDLTIRPLTGIPILLLVLAATFIVLVFGGGAIEGFLVGSYQDLARGFFDDIEAGASSDYLRGAYEGVYISVEAMLAIVVPYILVFYIMLSILEDTGYLVRVVSLLDGVMHRMGLHGRAIIPIVVGYGCNVPAILATRAVGSKRERLILATLITISVPCSAQTAIVIGTVGNYAGPEWALLLFGIMLGLLLILGLVMHRIMRFEPSGLFLEIPELRKPTLRQTAEKTYIRIKEFLTIAFPLLLAGSIVLEVLMAEGILQRLVDPTEPFMTGILGLPAITVVALIFGILRKEMALQMLMVLFGTSSLAIVLSEPQMFTFAIVMAVFMPCLAALAVLIREFGIKNTAAITAASIGLALALGAASNLILG